MCRNKKLSCIIVALVLALYAWPTDARASCGACGGGAAVIDTTHSHDGDALHPHASTATGMVCPVTGKPADSAYTMTIGGKTYGFADAQAMATFRASPLVYLKKMHARQSTASCCGTCGGDKAKCTASMKPAKPCCGTCGGDKAKCGVMRGVKSCPAASRCSVQQKKSGCSSSRYGSSGSCSGRGK